MVQPVAVLVDGDNIGGKNAAAILGIAREHGEPVVVRVYLDAKRASDWDNTIGYRLIHAGCGKNATDILLAIDAMDLVHARGVRRFVIATSDGDFTHLGFRLRELGAQVVGVGEAKAPRAFRESCSTFLELGARPTVKLVAVAPPGVTDLDRKVSAMIAEHGKDGTGMLLVTLGSRMNVEHGISTRKLPEKNWRQYLKGRPALFVLGASGPQAMVKLHPNALAAIS